MGRRRTNTLPNETLSQETPEVQEKILKELIKNDQDNEVKPDEQKDKNKDKILNKEQKKNQEEPQKTNFQINNLVKIKPDVKFDIMGKRIHAGLKGYTYRILSIRIDGMLIIECLTHTFTLKPEDVIKV